MVPIPAPVNRVGNPVSVVSMVRQETRSEVGNPAWRPARIWQMTESGPPQGRHWGPGRQSILSMRLRLLQPALLGRDIPVRRPLRARYPLALVGYLEAAMPVPSLVLGMLEVASQELPITLVHPKQDPHCRLLPRYANRWLRSSPSSTSRSGPMTISVSSPRSSLKAPLLIPVADWAVMANGETPHIRYRAIWHSAPCAVEDGGIQLIAL